MANGKRGFQKSKGMNPALQHAITEQKIKNALTASRREGINWAAMAYEIMTLMVLHDKFGMTDKDELRRYCKEMSNISDTMTKDYASLSDFIITLKDEAGFTITEDDLANIDPSLVGYLMKIEDKRDKNGELIN